MFRVGKLVYALCAAVRVDSVILVILACGLLPTLAVRGAADGGATPVLVELFTSEGCSSCPAADRLLERLDREQPFAGAQIVVMSEHVDYWNHDGWVDRYSSSTFTLRQRDYQVRLKLPDVFTPQIVVDGVRQCIGNNEAEVVNLIRKAAATPKVDVQIRGLDGAGKFQIEVNGGEGRGDVYVAFADEESQSDVSGGENRGRKLHHVAIVRKLRKAGKLDAKGNFLGEVSAGLPGPGRLIAFVQEPRTGAVAGVGLYRIPG